MRSSIAIVAGVCSTLTHAFADTSPFFLFSSESSSPLISRLRQGLAEHSSDLIQEGDRLSRALTDAATVCDGDSDDSYILVSQPDVSFQDYSSPKHASFFAARAQQGELSQFASQAKGNVSFDSLREALRRCKATAFNVDITQDFQGPFDEFPQVLTIDIPELPRHPKARNQKLSDYDAYLEFITKNYASGKRWHIFYATTPRVAKVSHAHQSYEYEGSSLDQQMVHQDLKRDTSSHLRQQIRPQASNETDDRGLFESYAFLNQGVFMGLVAGFLLIPILYVGFSALGSLQISEQAFTKEQAQAGQRKQQ